MCPPNKGGWCFLPILCYLSPVAFQAVASLSSFSLRRRLAGTAFAVSRIGCGVLSYLLLCLFGPLCL